MTQINLLAVLIAASGGFLVGGLWYSPALFGGTWQREAGDTRRTSEAHPAKVFGLSLFLALLSAFAYAWLIPAATSVAVAAIQGLSVGAALVGASFGINYQFANRSTKLWLIDGGYHTVQFLIYGLVIGLWR